MHIFAKHELITKNNSLIKLFQKFNLITFKRTLGPNLIRNFHN